MKSRDSITADRRITSGRTFICSAALLLFVQLYAVQTLAQRVAILTPDNGPRSTEHASDLAEQIGSPLKVLDNGLAEAAFRSLGITNPFNMTVEEARTAASVIGCDYFIVLRSDGLRRTSLAQGEYYETFAFFYLVDGRSGSLIEWTRETFEGDTQAKADDAFRRSVVVTAAKVTAALKRFIDRSTQTEKRALIEEVPAEGSPAASGLKPPIPYKRIKPEYTSIAFLYGVKATVDVEADIGADGEVMAIRFVRWAGFDLESAVQKAIREMSWRPAMRNGKPLPMRILLRYNFTKVDKEI